MIGEIRQNFTEASASVGLILATALDSSKTLNDRMTEQPTVGLTINYY